MSKPICGNCNELSCALRTMARFNIFLSMSAFLTGIVIIFTYPTVFGIDTSVDIILTPISLVFILEVDNWSFEVAKQFYPEAMNSWIITASGSDYDLLVKRKKRVWTLMQKMAVCVFCLAIGIAWVISHWIRVRSRGGLKQRAVTISSRVFTVIIGVSVLIAWILPCFRKYKELCKMYVQYKNEHENNNALNGKNDMGKCECKELKVLLVEQQMLLDQMQQDLNSMRKQMPLVNEKEANVNDHDSEKVLNKAMTDVLRMESVEGDDLN